MDARIKAWEEEVEGQNEQEYHKQTASYFYDLSLAPGWKVGGFANWSLTNPYPMNCGACGTAMTLLFTVASSDWGDSWGPVEEPEEASPIDTGVTIGCGYDLSVFRCPASEHPPATTMQ